MRNRERRTAWTRSYYQRNKERVAAYQKEWRKKNAARLKELRKTWPSQNKRMTIEDAPPTKVGLPDRRFGRKWGVRRPELKKEWSAIYDKLPERRAASLAARQRKGTKPRPGWTRELRRERLHEQGGLCAICHCRFGIRCVPQQDHSAATRIARGMLCVNCNHLLGKAKDSIANLESAIAYLRRYDQ